MKNKAQIKKELAAQYYGKEAKNYDKDRSEDLRKGYIVERKEDIFRKLLKNAKGKKILDVACGTGRFFRIYGKREIHGIDISEDQLEEAKRLPMKPTLKKCDATKICYPDNTFDVVITSQFIEHIPQYKDVIKEMVRVCKNGGSLIIDFPNKKSLTYLPTKIRILKGKLRHLNLFTVNDLRKIAKQFNLEMKDYENTVVITPNIFPKALLPTVKGLNKYLIKAVPGLGYLHLVRFVKK